MGTTSPNPLTTIVWRSSSRWFTSMTDTIIRCILVVPLVSGLSAASIAQEAAGEYSQRIEVFTTSAFPVIGKDTITQGFPDGGIELHVFTLDGLQQIEAVLSEGLPAEPEYARRTALKRIQQLGGAARTRMQNAAMGLARALEYGIDRYPAIVFDGRVVVYGITDLRQVLQHYGTWRTGAGS